MINEWEERTTRTGRAMRASRPDHPTDHHKSPISTEPGGGVLLTTGQQRLGTPRAPVRLRAPPPAPTPLSQASLTALIDGLCSRVLRPTARR
ncbi:hypothetical protein Pcinc_039799 [Petrolisthes cinctipes]|uniref:Uncharacterized protein n=1 Tax=Petrolisthes cinctipes TaxID=88211 RepID=A0AAE1BQZ7_PETCI|nr:hypothetical protein Pcinc_039799 [Petrolisthes cinctipes]